MDMTSPVESASTSGRSNMITQPPRRLVARQPSSKQSKSKNSPPGRGDGRAGGIELLPSQHAAAAAT